MSKKFILFTVVSFIIILLFTFYIFYHYSYSNDFVKFYWTSGDLAKNNIKSFIWEKKEIPTSWIGDGCNFRGVWLPSLNIRLTFSDVCYIAD